MSFLKVKAWSSHNLTPIASTAFVIVYLLYNIVFFK